MKELKYTRERNILLLISLLKKYRIKKVIVSPGTTNFTFVGSIQNDDYFELYSSADERSAAYMACGMAAESGEPVVITCTGATASRNYFPALTEAFYRKLPILAVMAHCGIDYIGNLRPQQIDRRLSPTDTYLFKSMLTPIHTSRDEQHTIIQVNKALTALTQIGGPVQLEIVTSFSTDFSVQTLPDVRKIEHYTMLNNLPDIPDGSIYIVIGSHKKFLQKEIDSIDKFCTSHNAIVICDHTSNYTGDFGVNLGLVCSQKEYDSAIKKCNLIIHIGEISGNYYGMILKPDNVWRVSEDGEIRDLFDRLSAVFEMSEKSFFDLYTSNNVVDYNNLKSVVKRELDYMYSLIPELPFSNIWIAQKTIGKLPKGSILHLGILNTLRAWDYFTKDESISTYSNVGGFGIDGSLSTCLGATLVNPNNLFFCILGDLAFFYDINSLGNRHLSNNLRIMLFNNGSGTEFRNYNHPAHDVFGDSADPYMAAAGHYGNKSPLLVKHYAEDLGFQYLTASNKVEYMKNLPSFVNPEIGDGPILFEVFTDSKDESDALEMMFHLVKPKDKYPSFKEKMGKLKNQVKCSFKAHYNGAIDKLKL